MATDSIRSSKAGKVSVWRSISDALRDDIKRGVFSEGERLPTDIELAQRFSCNKHTARRAIAHLEQEGVVRVEWGRGTFVVEGSPDAGAVGAQARLVHSLLDQHHELRKKVLSLETTPATAALARALRVSVSSPCLHLVLLGEVDRVPLSLGVYHLPLKRLPTLARSLDELPSVEELSSVAAILRYAGVKSHRRSRIGISARLPSSEEAAQLRMARLQPLLETESIEVDARNHPVLHARTCFRADRLQLVVPLA